MAEREYKRLTRARSSARFAVASRQRSSLWQGKDHVLFVESNGYTESYKRFYYRDIQAIIIRRTEAWKYVSLILAVVAGICGLFAAVARGPEVRWILGILGAIFALFGAINLAAGPSASCHLRTAAHNLELPSMNRLRRARKVLNRIRPLIAAAQGEFATPQSPATPADAGSEPPLAEAIALQPGDATTAGAPEPIRLPPSESPPGASGPEAPPAQSP